MVLDAISVADLFNYKTPISHVEATFKQFYLKRVDTKYYMYT